MHTYYCPSPFLLIPLILFCLYKSSVMPPLTFDHPCLFKKLKLATSPWECPIHLSWSRRWLYAQSLCLLLFNLLPTCPHHYNVFSTVSLIPQFTSCSLFNLFGHRRGGNQFTLYISLFAELSSPLPPASDVCSFYCICLQSVLLVHEFDIFLH